MGLLERKDEKVVDRGMELAMVRRYEGFLQADEQNVRVLLIDDIKMAPKVNVIARTYRDGIMALEKMGPFDVLMLDHDLGEVERQYDDTGKELTGYDILCWLENNPQYLPNKIVIVSLNGSGIQRMKLAIEALYRRGS